MCAKTTIMISPNFKENRIWLNGKEENFDNPRLSNCIKESKIAFKVAMSFFRFNIILLLVKSRTRLESADLLHGNMHICSENNFPTAAGLASSAAGYACLVYALSTLYEIEGDISTIARRGSGSACRSVLGGWVNINF